MKNSSDTIGNRTRDLPTCSAVHQPTALRRAPDTEVDLYFRKLIFEVSYVLLEVSKRGTFQCPFNLLSRLKYI
jgi:hypothetical protein